MYEHKNVQAPQPPNRDTSNLRQFPTETTVVACPILLTAYIQQGVTCSMSWSLYLRLPPNSAFKIWKNGE